jgi:hypothetical protein
MKVMTARLEPSSAQRWRQNRGNTSCTDTVAQLLFGVLKLSVLVLIGVDASVRIGCQFLSARSASMAAPEDQALLHFWRRLLSIPPVTALYCTRSRERIEGEIPCQYIPSL